MLKKNILNQLDQLENNLSCDLVQKEKKYELNRSDSNMSLYSDLVEEILNEQDIKETDLNLSEENYEIVDVIKENLEKYEILKKQKEIESQNKKLGQYARHKKITLEEKKKKQKENDERKKSLKLPENIEIDYSEEFKNQIIHLYRGKNLNTTCIDPINPMDSKKIKQRYRTKEEKEDYVTKKYNNKTVYSDGTFLIKNKEERMQHAERITSEHFKTIKENKNKEGITSLFNELSSIFVYSTLGSLISVNFSTIVFGFYTIDKFNPINYFS